MRSGIWTALATLAGLFCLLPGCSSNDKKPVDEPAATSRDRVRADFSSLRELSRAYGFRQSVESGSGKWMLERDGHKVVIDPATRAAYFDGELVVLDAAPMAVANELYVGPEVKERLAAYPRASATANKETVRPLPRARSQSLSGRRFVIDAGHGGKDPGTQAAGVVEKNIVLDIARLVAEGLRGAGATVVMTRSDDTFIELDDRVAISNRIKPDAFVSIHINSSQNKDARGIEIYRPIDQLPGHSPSKISRSTRLANALYKRLDQVSPAGDRGVKPNSRHLIVVRKTNQPAVLVEFGFVTNAADRSLMSNPSYRRKLADAVVESLRDFSAELP